ncbi:MAG TPA: type II toxin-antitoxin system HicA family toxin [Nitrososphaerales archaeon]|nr:type II toxin-antitoxin system HicA family toxin [Nitrososphaerales archaeon]
MVRQRGSHIFLARNEVVVPVPRHDELKRGTLMAIITEAGLTKEEFIQLLR